MSTVATAPPTTPAPPTPLWRRKLRELFGIDPRSLALFRVALALVIIGDLIDRAWWMTAHYTDAGVLPRNALLQFFPNEAGYCLHLISGSTGVQASLFLVAGVFAGMLLVGCRTRLASVVTWAMLLSLQNRNPLVNQSGDVLLRLLAFWAMFLPLGMKWSVDSARRGRAAPPLRGGVFLSPATVAILLQVCFVYWFGYLAKLGPVWEEGRALHYALSSDYFVTSTGLWLRGLTWAHVPLTLSVLYLELLGPFVAFCPVFTGPVRVAVITIFVLAHAGFRVFLYIGIFPWVSFVGWMVFVPSWLWDRPRVVRLTRRVEGWFGASPANENIAADGPSRPAAAVVWRSLATGAVVAASLYYVLLCNLRDMASKVDDTRVPASLGYLANALPFYGWLDPVGRVIRLDQRWVMFSPSPPMESGWYIVQARLANYKDVDLFTDGKPVTMDHPPVVSALFPNNRWHKFLENIGTAPYKKMWLYYCRYLCRDWNQRHPAGERIIAINVYWMLEKTLPDGISEPERVSIAFHACED